MAMKEYELADVTAGGDDGESYFDGGGASSNGLDAGQLLSGGGKLSDGAGGEGGGGGEGQTVWCGCLSLVFYQQFFRVDTKDVTERWIHSIVSWRRETGFLDVVADNPDAYGPFWNSTTLIFLLALTTNLSEGEYDLNLLVISTWVVYGFAAGAPVLVWLVLNQLGTPIALVQLGCTYGYSLGPYLPAVLACALPLPYMAMVALAAAGVLSVVFLLRALTPILLERNAAVASPVMAGLGVLQVLFTLVIKFAFF
ncbi:unnamed protein product [Pylaiella littoralis]